MKEVMRELKRNITDFIAAVGSLWRNIKMFFGMNALNPQKRADKTLNDLSQRDMYEFIEQKKNRKPFYKDDRSKMWE